MVKPYYEANGVTIYLGDCREVMPQLSHVSAMLTEPQAWYGQTVAFSGTPIWVQQMAVALSVKSLDTASALRGEVLA